MKVYYFLIAIAAIACCNCADINRSQVLTVFPKHITELDFLKRIYDSGEYDFWKPISHLGEPVEILVNQVQLPAFESHLKKNGIPYSIKIEDVEYQIKESLLINDKARTDNKAMEWTAYHKLEEIYAWIDELADLYPDLVTVTEIGKSYKGRPIKMVKISTGGDNKPAVFSEATIHAREWIAPATISYIINELLTNRDSHSRSLDEVDFYFVVVTNPDGYAYSWASSLTRLWRKTRRPYANGCIGADPNRNFDYKWNKVGTSSDPCSQIYPGTYPFSEDCTKAVADEMVKLTGKARAYVGFHSYGEVWLRPWGYQNKETEDSSDIIDLCNKATDAAFPINGVGYKCVLGGESYQAGGVSDDYAYEVARMKYAYTIELRDQGYGFLLPPNQIIPSGKEVFASFQVIFEHVRDNPDDAREN